MVNTVWVNAVHGRDFHPLADHMTKIFQHFKQALSNLIVCLMISHTKYIEKLHKRASMLQWILDRFVFCKINMYIIIYNICLVHI